MGGKRTSRSERYINQEGRNEATSRDNRPVEQRLFVASKALPIDGRTANHKRSANSNYTNGGNQEGPELHSTMLRQGANVCNGWKAVIA
jgi:hypothetical protein